MSRRPGSSGWRDARLAAERERQRDDTSSVQEAGVPEWEYWAALAARHRGATAAILVVLLLLVIVLTHRGQAHTGGAKGTSARGTSHPQAEAVTRTPWTDAEARPFTTGLWATILTTTGPLRTGPAQLWPPAPAGQPAPGTRLVVLGQTVNSQESAVWLAVRLPDGEAAWLPQAAVALSGTLRPLTRGPTDSYIVTGQQPLVVVRRPDLPDRLGGTPPLTATTTVGPGSVLPLRGVLPRYFDGRRDTAWLRVGLPDGSVGWLQQQGSNLRRDIRYLLPPPGGATSPWTVPLAAGHTLLGAYGEALGTAQWPVRGGTLVRGEAGNPVQAVADGVVIFSGYSLRWNRYYVVVRHTGAWEGWQTAYLGLTSSGAQGLKVHDGQAVRRGQVLGYLAQGVSEEPTSLLFVVQTPDGTPIESQNVLQWP